MKKDAFTKSRSAKQGFKTFIYSFPFILLFLLFIDLYVNRDFGRYDIYVVIILSAFFSILLVKKYNQKWLNEKNAKKRAKEIEHEIRREKERKTRKEEYEKRRKTRKIKKALQKPLTQIIGQRTGKMIKNFKKGFEEGGKTDN